MDQITKRVSSESGLNQFLTKVYALVGIATLISAATAFVLGKVYMAETINFLKDHQYVLSVIVILPLALILILSLLINKMNTATALLLYFTTSVVYGAIFSLLCMIYTDASLVTAFISSFAVFAVLAVIGTRTNRNLNNLGSYALAALIGLIVATFVNLFVGNSIADFIFSILGVIIFTALTVYDAQKTKEVYLESDGTVSDTKLAVMGALNLYLDLINLFINLLRIFGKEK
ncbi:MAG: Bax inhibitor-1/YccA family protein [Lactobacillus sp.]|nr:Bax inhibitor-1/YccA family protein [Lactobacillus sp.]